MTVYIRSGQTEKAALIKKQKNRNVDTTTGDIHSQDSARSQMEKYMPCSLDIEEQLLQGSLFTRAIRLFLLLHAWHAGPLGQGDITAAAVIIVDSHNIKGSVCCMMHLESPKALVPQVVRLRGIGCRLESPMKFHGVQLLDLVIGNDPTWLLILHLLFVNPTYLLDPNSQTLVVLVGRWDRTMSMFLFQFHTFLRTILEGKPFATAGLGRGSIVVEFHLLFVCGR